MQLLRSRRKGPARTAPEGLSPDETSQTENEPSKALEIVADQFCRDLPSPKTAVDIFAGDWSSQLPPPYEELTGGQVALFDDKRIHWAAEHFGGIVGMRVLELGPLEGGHTYMLDRKGAREVTAVEANRRAFLRCLIVKEVLGMPSARFLCGDFVRYLEDAAKEPTNRWDLCVAAGVLYHQQEPVALLDLAGKVSDRLFLWTHYFDESVLSRREDLWPKFTSSTEATTCGFAHTLHRYEYGAALDWSGFCGGLASWTTWMDRADILASLEHLGFSDLAIEYDEPEHPNGPAFCVAATKRA